MFESLQEGLGSALKTLRGRGKLTESNMRDGLRLVQQALLEADVSFPVVRQFMVKVTEPAVPPSSNTAVIQGLEPVGAVPPLNSDVKSKLTDAELAVEATPAMRTVARARPIFFINILFLHRRLNDRKSRFILFARITRHCW